MREWKHRHGPAGDENAGVEISGVGLNEIALSDKCEIQPVHARSEFRTSDRYTRIAHIFAETD